MKNAVFLLITLCVLPTTAVANDRAEEGTAASRNVALLNGQPNDFLVLTASTNDSEAAGIPTVRPTGSDPDEIMLRRYSVGNSDVVDFQTIKRRGIEFNGNSN